MPESVREVCRDWLRELPAWHRVGVRGAGLLASEAVKHLVIPELQRFPVPPNSDTGAEQPPTPDLEHALDAVAPQVSRWLEQAREAIDDGILIAETRNLDITPAKLGGSVLRAMGKAITLGAPMSDQEIATHVAGRLAKTAVAGRILPRPDFAADYAQLFDEMWRRTGMKNMQDFPHSDPGLGPDEQPPLVRYDRENTWLGTARSVYSRYTCAAKDAEVPGNASALARGEVSRACGRWGLLGESTFVVMRSLYSGLNSVPLEATDLHPDAGDFSKEWQKEPGPLREIEAAHSLAPTGKWVHGELAANAQALLASYLARQEAGRFLKQAGRVHEAQEDALKRAWMLCFEDDRREVEPDASRGRYIARTAIHKGIPDGQAQRKQRFMRSGDWATKTDDPAERFKLREATVEYMLSIGPERARRLLMGDEGEARLYHEASQDEPMLPLKEVMTMGPTPGADEHGAQEGDRDAH